jgi:hypothetical protein
VRLDPRVSGAAAALLWALVCLRWFDVAAVFRPVWLAVLPPWALALPGAAFLAAWLHARRHELLGAPLAGPRGALLLVVSLAVLFRLPLAFWGAEGYTTADAALSGIVALRIRAGLEHYVFVPMVPYSGSLKSHLAVPLSALFGMVRAFTLTSVAFYAAFVAAVYALGSRLGAAARERGRTALAAGLWAAFAPTFVTQYSLSNDGNYVEVLAFGTWALVLAARFPEEREARPRLALAAGLLLGLAFWCHILGVIHAATVVAVIVTVERTRALPALARLLGGAVLGYLPGVLWNLANGGESLYYLVPRRFWDPSYATAAAAAPAEPGLLERGRLLLLDHGPVLFGLDHGYGTVPDAAYGLLSALGLTVALVAVAAALARVVRSRRLDTEAVLLAFGTINVLVVLLALPHIPGIPRYSLFLFAPAAVLVARLLDDGWRRAVLGGLIAFGALGSLLQADHKLEQAAEWRSFVKLLESSGVRYCYSDFYLSTPISFFSGERVVCSSKLGPSTTEYFLDYRTRVDHAPAPPAIVAVNQVSALRIERHLRRLGVDYTRRDGMKPVFLNLSRRVDPQEIFPGRRFLPR